MEIIDYNTALSLYSINGKLLTIQKDYKNNQMIVAYDPKISRGFCRHNSKELSEAQNTGYRNQEEEFELDNSTFRAVWNYYKQFSPLRGYKKLEIFKEEESIIKTEQGRKGPGMSYGSNNGFFLSEDESEFYVLGEGFMLHREKLNEYYGEFEEHSYYLLSFDNFDISPINPSYSLDKFLFEGIEYTEEQIKPYVQTIWEVTLFDNNYDDMIEIRKTGIPHFANRWVPNPEMFMYRGGMWSGCVALEKLQFYLNGEEIECKRPKFEL
jgi:hypothetical protein